MTSLIALLVLLPTSAWAVSADDLSELSSNADELDAAARALEKRVGTGGSTKMSDEDALGRFEKYLFFRLVGRHQEAAEGFFGLVTTGALSDPDLHRDAEWHLAESLFGMGNVVTAEARFKVISEDPYHPFRAESVRRLLDLYADQEDFDSFYKLYESEIVQGKVKPTSEITYTIAKSFYKQGDFARALRYFNDILPEHPEFTRARYFLGVLAIRDGRVAEAGPFFDEASLASIDSVDGRRIHDLALLAKARLAYERDEFLEAAINYQKVGGDSDYLDDVLFEQTWSWIKQKRYDEALQSVGIFLLAFPEHRYAGDLRVIEGHLHMGCAQSPSNCPDPSLAIEQGDPYEQALSKYEAIVDDYSPIRDSFADLRSSDAQAFEHFNASLVPDGVGDGGIPQFALAMMRNDPGLEKAISISDRLDSQRHDLEASEAMIELIRSVLSTDNGQGGFEGARYEAIANQSRVAIAQIELLEKELAWLSDEGAEVAAQRGLLSSLTSKKDGVRQRIELASQKRDRHLSKVSTARSVVTTVEEGLVTNRASLAELQAKMDQVGSRERGRLKKDADAIGTEITSGEARLASLQNDLVQMQLPTSEMADDASIATVSKGVSDLRGGLVPARPKKIGLADDFDTLHSRLERLQIKYEDLLARMKGIGKTDLSEVRERFEAEVVLVEAERADLISQQKAADRLAATVTRAGLGRMENFFADSVMKADTGIVDVYWSRKLELADERQKVQDERNAIVDELERRFTLIRQKMEQ